MSLVDVQGGVYVPGTMIRFGVSTNTYGTTLDAAGEFCGAVIQIPKDGNLTKIGFRTGTVTVSDAIEVRVETVDPTTGRPTGILIHADAYGIQVSVSANTTYWVELQDPVAVTKSYVPIAVVVKFNSYVAGNLIILHGLTFQSSSVMILPYIFHYIGSTLFSNNLFAAPNFGLEYDGVIEPLAGAFPAIASGAQSWGKNDNPDRHGLALSFPYSCEVIGIFFLIDLDGGTEIEFYDSDGITIIPKGTIVLDKDIKGSTAGVMSIITLTTPIELAKNETYRVVLHPTSTTNISLAHLDVTNDGAVEAMNAIDGGVDWYYTSCNSPPTNITDWTNLLTRRPLMGFLINQLDDGQPRNLVTGAVVTGQSTAGIVIGE